jgi:Arc/MetJ-type ribon-helix-helix transcriptional regulator
MRDTIVSIKMPESLLEELRKAARDRHFMDLSEEIRSIVRRKWLEFNDPEIMRIKRLKDDIESTLEKKSELMARRKIVSELEKIKQKVQGEKNG